MNLRISKRDYKRLVLSAMVYYLRKTQIVRKAFRKWNRLGVKSRYVEKTKKKENSTYKGKIIYLPDDLMEGIGRDLARKIITWYLDDQKPRKAVPLELETCKAGYEVKSLEN
jgi:hypothetical protein